MYKYDQLRDKNVFVGSAFAQLKVFLLVSLLGEIAIGSSHHVTGKLHYLLSFLQ